MRAGARRRRRRRRRRTSFAAVQNGLERVTVRPASMRIQTAVDEPELHWASVPGELGRGVKHNSKGLAQDEHVHMLHRPPLPSSTDAGMLGAVTHYLIKLTWLLGRRR